VKPAEYIIPQDWTPAKAAAAAVSATVETLEQIGFNENKRRATVEICDPNGVAYYVIEITRVREMPKNLLGDHQRTAPK
jgi:hypothetical protein